MLYLSLADTERLDLRMIGVLPYVEEALRLAAQGKSVAAPRLRLVHPPLDPNGWGEGRPWKRDIRITSGAIEGMGFGVRVGASLDHRSAGVVLLLFDWETMKIRAIISDYLVHAIRSAAPDGIFAKYLARDGSTCLALIGSGRLARWAAEAVCAMRPITRVQVWSPDSAHRQECARYLEARLNTSVTAVDSPEQATRGADVVVTATSAREGVVHREWLSPGCTVVTNRPEELGADLLEGSRLVTTYLDGLLGHVPPYRALLDLLESTHRPVESLVTELSDIITGRAPGRSSADETIVCLNPAYGVLDCIVANYIYERAVATGIGTRLQP